MWGSVIGDIIGSSFENENLRSPYFELFAKGSRFTDDTVCVAAVSDILEQSKLTNTNLDNDYISNKLRLWCCTYLNRGFGSMFYQWIANGINRPYGSYGNGALMRISPVAKFAVKYNIDKQTCLDIATQITNVSHNHPQAINAVQAYISIIYDLLLHHKTAQEYMSLDAAKNLIVKNLADYNIPEPLTIEKYRVNTDFDITCNTSLGVACAAILETDNFEDVMHQVVSAGGDSDTYAAIAGAIAESLYGISNDMMEKIKPFFREYDKDIIIALENLYYEESITIMPIKTL
jgi:ADP-ribosyl-[dinitrogen reductase] hydrolase